MTQPVEGGDGPRALADWMDQSVVATRSSTKTQIALLNDVRKRLPTYWDSKIEAEFFYYSSAMLAEEFVEPEAAKTWADNLNEDQFAERIAAFLRENTVMTETGEVDPKIYWATVVQDTIEFLSRRHPPPTGPPTVQPAGSAENPGPTHEGSEPHRRDETVTNDIEGNAGTGAAMVATGGTPGTGANSLPFQPPAGQAIQTPAGSVTDYDRFANSMALANARAHEDRDRPYVELECRMRVPRDGDAADEMWFTHVHLRQAATDPSWEQAWRTVVNTYIPVSYLSNSYLFERKERLVQSYVDFVLSTCSLPLTARLLSAGQNYQLELLCTESVQYSF